MMNVEKLFGRELFGTVVETADDFGSLFLRHGKVALVPGTGFGAPKFVRWAYAASLEDLTEGLNRLEKFLSGTGITDFHNL